MLPAYFYVHLHIPLYQVNLYSFDFSFEPMILSLTMSEIKSLMWSLRKYNLYYYIWIRVILPFAIRKWSFTHKAGWTMHFLEWRSPRQGHCPAPSLRQPSISAPEQSHLLLSTLHCDMHFRLVFLWGLPGSSASWPAIENHFLGQLLAPFYGSTIHALLGHWHLIHLRPIRYHLKKTP